MINIFTNLSSIPVQPINQLLIYKYKLKLLTYNSDKMSHNLIIVLIKYELMWQEDQTCLCKNEHYRIDRLHYAIQSKTNVKFTDIVYSEVIDTSADIVTTTLTS